MVGERGRGQLVGVRATGGGGGKVRRFSGELPTIVLPDNPSPSLAVEVRGAGTVLCAGYLVRDVVCRSFSPVRSLGEAANATKQTTREGEKGGVWTHNLIVPGIREERERDSETERQRKRRAHTHRPWCVDILFYKSLLGCTNGGCSGRRAALRHVMAPSSGRGHWGGGRERHR